MEDRPSVLHFLARPVGLNYSAGAPGDKCLALRVGKGLRRTMRARVVLLGLLGLLVLACQPSPGGPYAQLAPQGELVISSFGGAWGQAIQLGLIDSFQRETGIQVTLLDAQDDAHSAALVASGRLPPEDLIDTNAATAAALQRDGLLAPIDYDAFDASTLSNLPDYAKQSHTIGWGQFAIGLCYDREVFPDEARAPRTWADFWDVGEFPGARAMLAWTEEPQPEFGLLAGGISAQELYPLDVERAFQKLDELRPHMPRFPANPAELGQMMADREVVMAACFTHRAQRLVDGGLTRIAISFDEARLQTAHAVVWRNAPNRENAMKFLAHVLKAQSQAAWAQIGSTGPINPDAFQFIPAEQAARLPTSPAYPSWARHDPWYWAEGEAGKTNRELLVERWRTWLAACGPRPDDPGLPAWHGARVGSRGC